LIALEVQLIHKAASRDRGTPRCLGEFGPVIVDKCVECAGASGVGRAGISLFTDPTIVMRTRVSPA
jgi:hypothetical protein